MNKFLEKIMLLIGIIIGIPLLLIACIGYLVYVPFDMIQYHKMPYYKDLKNKYQFFITSRDVVKFYNYIASKKLSIEYIKNEDYEYFVQDGVVLLSGWSNFDFEKDDDGWRYTFSEDDEDKSMSTQEIIAYDREMLKAEHKDMPVKILMLCSKKETEKLEFLKECPHLYVVEL